MDRLKFLFQIILVIINFLSIIILLQVVFEIIPCWKCNWSIDKVARINDMAKDFSITILSSTFFYLLLVIIPERIKQHFVRRRTQNVIDRMANDMQEIIAYLVHKGSLPQKNHDSHYVKIAPKAFDSIRDISRDNQTGFYYSYDKNGKKELINVSNWDEISFLYPRLKELKRVIDDYQDIPIIVNEDPNLVFLTRKIGQSTLIANVELKHSISIGIIPHMNESIKSFYSLYQSLFRYTKNMQVLNVGDKDAAKIISVPVID